MKNLKKGDKVKVYGTQNQNTFHGKKGIILDVHNKGVTIQFDKKIRGGHKGMAEKGKDGHCWEIDYSNKFVTLTKIDSKFKKLLKNLYKGVK